MGKTIVLNNQEKESLLAAIDSREMYNAVLAVIDTVKHKDNNAYSLEQYQNLAQKAVTDAKHGINYTSIEDMRFVVSVWDCKRNPEDFAEIIKAIIK